MIERFCRALRFSLRFATLQFVFTFLLVLIVLWRAPDSEGLLTWSYLVTLPSYYFVLIALIVLLFSPLSLFRVTRPLLILPMVALHCYLIADLFVFDVYRFHINQMMIDMFIFDLKGTGIPAGVLAVAALAVVILIVVNIWLMKQSVKLRWKHALWLSQVMLVMFVYNQFVHIWGKGFNQNNIIQYSLYLPLHFPISSSGTAKAIEEHFPGWVPVQTAQASLPSTTGNRGTLHYPLTQAECGTGKENPNILLFVLESWRADMLTEHITPNMYRFSQQSFRFDNHLSGGNVTISGLFTLLYGLHPNYLNQVRAAPLNYQSVLHKTLADSGYKGSVYTSSDLSRFSMRQMFFHGIEDNDYHFIRDKSSIQESDRSIADLIKQHFVEEQSTPVPWYRFVFLTSSHFPYNYPEAYAKFQPAGDSSNFVLDKSTDNEPLLNDYKNSLYYQDALFAEILASLETTGALDNTLVVITSDHGEAFNDNGLGYWGHGSIFSWEQIGTPLVMRLPGQQSGQVIATRSSHIDVAPSLLRQGLGCKADWTRISNGKDLLNLPENRPLMSTSYVTNAYIVDEAVFEEKFGISSYELRDVTNQDLPVPYDKVRQLMADAQWFLE